jgi:hypothetical protein
MIVFDVFADVFSVRRHGGGMGEGSRDVIGVAIGLLLRYLDSRMRLSSVDGRR